MNKYETIEIKYWVKNQTYCYNFSNDVEIIEREKSVTEVVNQYNQNGYVVCGVYLDSGKPVFVMTREILIP